MKNPILALIAGTLFFVACGGPPPPGAEFIGQWEASYKRDLKDSQCNYKVSFEITHNIDNQYFVVSPSANYSCSDGFATRYGGDSQKFTAIYRDGTMIIRDDEYVRKADGDGSDRRIPFWKEATIDKNAGKLAARARGGLFNVEFSKK